MTINILTFVFVYFFSGFVLSLFIKSIAKNSLDRKLTCLLGFGISPLLISLILYCLYSFFPAREWAFYALILFSLFLIIFVISRKEKTFFFEDINRDALKNVLKKILALSLGNKILFIFVLFVTIFTLTRNICYPADYTDAVEYLKQGYVYSQDRSLDRLRTRESFADFGEANPLYGPESKFQISKSVRPALPIFYSFFYHSEIPDSFTFTSIKFIYSYYFLLSIFLIAYIISRFKRKNILIGLTLVLSCYFFTKLSYSDYKEIIISYLALLALFLLYKLIDEKKLIFAVFLGTICGLLGYINYSGLILSGIIFLLGLVLFKTSLKKKILTILIILASFFIFSGNEILRYKDFVFNKKLISIENQEKTFSSAEFSNRLVAENKPGENKLGILITKKLQAFTQIQFFGFLFWFLLTIILSLILKREKINYFSKITLYFILLFFFIFSDPFFLNPHKYAYILSIGYRYTAILSVFVGTFVALNCEIFLNSLKKIDAKYFQIIVVFSFLLIAPLRTYIANIILNILNHITIQTNPNEYYLYKVNIFLLAFALFSLIYFFIIFYYRSKFKELPRLIITLFFLIIFIFPFVYSLNSNQNIINTFRYPLQKNIPYKIGKVVREQKSKEVFEAIAYINQNIDKNAPILIETNQFGSASYNFWLYTTNNSRIIGQQDVIDFPNKFYYLSKNKDDSSSSGYCTNVNGFYSASLSKCERI